MDEYLVIFQGDLRYNVKAKTPYDARCAARKQHRKETGATRSVLVSITIVEDPKKV